MSYSENKLEILNNCKDYDYLINNLTHDQIKNIEKVLKHYLNYLEHSDDIDKYIFNYGNSAIIHWYEGTLNTEDFIDRYKTYQNYYQLQTKAEKAYFSCNDENIYEGYYFDNMSWNGWKVPFFTKETVDKIAENLQDEFYELKYNSSKNEYILIDKAYIDIDNPSQDPKEYSEIYSSDTLIYEGEEIQVYAIGGFFFAWDLVDNLENDLKI